MCIICTVSKGGGVRSFSIHRVKRTENCIYTQRLPRYLYGRDVTLLIGNVWSPRKEEEMEVKLPDLNVNIFYFAGTAEI